MGKFDGLLFCTDLDGTLYQSDTTVSRENREAIRYFQSEGGLFTFITGRIPMTSHEICRVIEPNAPYGCINGGGIYDPHQGTYLWKTTLPYEAIELVEYIDHQLPDIGIQINTEQDVYFSKDNSAMEWFRKVTGVPPNSRHYRDITEPMLKVLFAHEDEARLDEAARLLNGHPKAKKFDFIRSEKILYELLPKGVSKGAVLEKMAQLLGVDINRTIAVGDYENDVSMIRVAGVGYAVANARPAAKAVADRITVSNDEHAIAKIVEEIDTGMVRL